MNTATRPLRIAVADDERDTRQFFEEFLPRLGHEVVAATEDGRQLVEKCRQVRPDLVITDVKMPEMDGIQAAAAINHERELPVILLTGHHDADTLGRAAADHVMAYLSKPAKPVDLQAAIALAILRFAHYQALKREAADLRQALEDRKVIERAKGTVMRRLGLDEPEAFHRLQKQATSQNRKLIEVAREILQADEVFQALQGR